MFRASTAWPYLQTPILLLSFMVGKRGHAVRACADKINSSFRPWVDARRMLFEF